jgi:hypothetical protein
VAAIEILELTANRNPPDALRIRFHGRRNVLAHLDYYWDAVQQLRSIALFVCNRLLMFNPLVLNVLVRREITSRGGFTYSSTSGTKHRSLALTSSAGT